MRGTLDRIELLRDLLAERIVVIDGAAGTSIQDMHLNAADFGGPQLEGCNENLIRTRPDKIRELHDSFLDAGADIIETNTFGAASVVLAEYGLAEHAREINRLAGSIARAAADAATTPKRPRFVAGSMGPTTKAISVTGGVTFDQLAAAYQEQAEGLIEGGVDLLLLETVQDTLNCKAGLVGIERAIASTGIEVAIAVSGTIETMGTLLAGQDIEAFYTSLANRELIWMGLNCATGPDFMTDHLRTLAEICRFDVACVPNAGLPDEEGHYNESPESLARKLERFVDAGWVNLVGGCCGTTPAHIRMLAQMAEGKRPRTALDAAPFGSVGNRGAGDRRQHAPGDRRRAHQRARQPQVQAADRRGQDSRRRPRSAACRCGAAPTCSTSACRIRIATRSPT